MSRITCCVLSFVAVLGLAIGGCEAGGKDAQTAAALKVTHSPSGAEWDGVARVVAVGDVHGDFGQFVKILRLAGVIDQDNNWSAGRTHLVQTGDVFDRGPDSRQALDLLMKLEAQAADAGGAVHALLGNHEAMVLLGDLRYMTEEEKESFGGPEGLGQLMAPDGKYGRWLRVRKAVVRINDTVFVHGSVTAETLAEHKTLDEINRVIRVELAEGKADGLAMSANGPLWSRQWPLVANAGDEAGPDISDVLKGLGAERMVVGHTAMRDGVTPGLNGRLVMIDVGMSAVFGGKAACIVIEDGRVWVVQDDADKRPLAEPAPAAEHGTEQQMKPAA